MSNVPFLYVNILAFCCFLILLTGSVSSKKTSAIWAFIAVLIDCVFWSGGSILMRLQLWPGVDFWFYVSLVALFIMECLFYIFVHVFYCDKKKGGLIFCIIGTLAILPGTVTGFFLKPPVPTIREDGSLVFLYETDWHIIIPCILFIIIIGLTAALLLRLVKKHGIHSPGLLVIIWGGVIMLVGNLLQVSLSGNVFPYDALAGIIFAVLLMVALYKRRMFRLQLIISKTILFIVMAIICVVMALYLTKPFQGFAVGTLKLEISTATSLTAVMFAIVLVAAYTLLKKLSASIFTDEEQQGKEIQNFTTEISQLLNTNEIMDRLSKAILTEISVDRVFVCMYENGKYVSRYCSSPLAISSFSIDCQSPQVTYLNEQETYIILREFESNPMFLSTWQSEKDLFKMLQISSIAALKDGEELIGLVLLSADDENKEYRFQEIAYLETICSVTSIAMKNARLYEQMFREARVDSMTGVYNLRYFNDVFPEIYKECENDSIALMYVDVDDFKLYNQLYGVEAADEALKNISECITQCIGTNDDVFRTSGKVFAIVLRHQDVHHSCAVADEIRRRIKEINHKNGLDTYKELSVSIGICVAPYAASSAKELIDNADFATFYAKQNGKDGINVFREKGTVIPKRIVERTDRIIEDIFDGTKEKQNSLSMINALTAAIDAKDHYTYFHSKNVAKYATCLAVAMGLNDDQIKTIYVAGLLHDVGKISIPEQVLNKQGRLTDEEFTLIKEHVNNSIEMIKYLPGMDYIVPAVLGHHERYDGKGYPRGISGDEIPIGARCLAVADVFDAMTTDRPYRQGKTVEYAISQFKEFAGTQFDPELAAKFIELLENNEIVLNKRAQENVKKDRLY